MSGTKARRCGTKVARTKAEAKAYALWCRRNLFARMSAYRCPDCGTWHVGHRRNPSRRRAR